MVKRPHNKGAAPEMERIFLAAAAQRQASLEVRRRLERILEKLERPITSPERLRPLRAIEALEQIRTPDALDILQKLANGTPEARLTQEATATLEYLAMKVSTQSERRPKE